MIRSEVAGLRLSTWMTSGFGSGSGLPSSHLEEAVEDDEEFLKIGGKSSASDIFQTFVTDFQTKAPALEHHFLKSS